MDAFDQYFRTLRLLLPRGERDDIVRELSEEIRAQAAELEAERGRPLTPDEQAALLAQLGHPFVTAARYRPSRSLIGPLVFPFYKLLMQVVLALTAAGHVIAAIVLVASGRPLADVGGLVEGLIADLLKIVGWITVLFAAFDAWLTRSQWLASWNPTARHLPSERMLRRLDRALRVTPGSTAYRSVSLTGFIVSVVVGVWWLAGLKLPWLFFGPGGTLVSWGPAMDRVYPALVLAQAALIADYFIRLTRIEADRILHVIRIAWVAAGVLLGYLVVTSAHDWMIWSNSVGSGGGRNQLITIAGYALPQLDAVNYLLSIIFVAAAAAGVAKGMVGLLRWLKRRRPAAASA
jgi:hypothetical protein